MLGFLLVDITLRGDRDSDVKSHVYLLFFTDSVIQQYGNNVNLLYLAVSRTKVIQTIPNSDHLQYD